MITIIHRVYIRIYSFFLLLLLFLRRNCHSQNHSQLPGVRSPHSAGAAGGYTVTKLKLVCVIMTKTCFYFVFSVFKRCLHSSGCSVNFFLLLFSETGCQFHHQQQRDGHQKRCSLPGRQAAHHPVCAGWDWPWHRGSSPHRVLFCRCHHQLHREGKSSRKWRALTTSSLFSVANRLALYLHASCKIAPNCRGSCTLHLYPEWYNAMI